jgi:hypothetical protein
MKPFVWHTERSVNGGRISFSYGLNTNYDLKASI